MTDATTQHATDTVTDDVGEPMEWTDAANVVQGTLSRAEIHARELRHRSVHVAIFDDEGRLYLHRRAAGKDVLPGHWEISAAGHVAPGESYAAAAARELAEELRLSVPLTPLYVSEARAEVGHEFAALYVGAVTRGVAPSPDPREIERGAFFSPEELIAHLADPATRPVPSMLNGVRVILHRCDETPAGPCWSPDERARLVAAVRAHPAYPGDVPGHPASHALLASTASGAADDDSAAVMPGVQRSLERVLLLALFGVMLAATLLYPLLFGPDRLTRLSQTANGLATSGSSVGHAAALFLVEQVGPYVMGTMSPLILKRSAVGMIVLLALPAFVLLLLLRPATPLRRRPFHLGLVAFVAGGVASAVFVLNPDFLYIGGVTLACVVLFALIVAMAATVARTPARQKRLLVLAMLPLAAVALIAFAQHLWPVGILPKAATERNRMAATIGHNNGVAGILMFAWFPALAAVFLARRAVARGLALLAAAFLAFLFLALQTRGVWVALAVLTPVFVAIAARERGWRLRPWHVLSGGLVVLLFALALSIDSPRNPFRGEVPLVERLGDLSPDKLKSTTQRRIFVLSVPYMSKDARRFLLGVGLGGFAPNYARMQGDYYAARQGDVDIYIPADKRTAQAHSDILQVFIELGFVGLLVVLFLIWLFVRDVETTWRATPAGAARVLQLAIVFPVVATLLHGLYDFPFHVASTAAYFAIFLGMTLAGRRAWTGERPPVPPPNALQQRLVAPGAAGGLARTATLSAVLALYVPCLVGMFALQSIIVADYWRYSADNDVSTYLLSVEAQNSVRGQQLLLSAKRKLNRAGRLSPLDPDINLTKAHLFQTIGTMLIFRHDQEMAAGDTGTAAALREQARHNFRAVLAEIEAANRGGAEYFNSHFIAAVALKLLARLADDPAEQRQYVQRQVLALQQSIRQNPAAGAPMTELLGLVERERPNDREYLALLRRTLLRHNEPLYHTRYTERFSLAVQANEMGAAAAILALLREDQPDDARVAFYEVSLLSHFGRIAEAKAALERVRRQYPDFEEADAFAIGVALKGEDWAEANRLARKGLSVPGEGEHRIWLEAVRAYTAEMLGEPDAAELVAELERKMAGRDGESLLYQRYVADALYFHLGQRERALEIMERRAQTVEPPPPPRMLLPLAERALEAGDRGRARGLFTLALVGEPRDAETLAAIDAAFGAGSEEATAIRRDAAAELDRRVLARDRAMTEALRTSQGLQ